jgi:hypothetical protein
MLALRFLFVDEDVVKKSWKPVVPTIRTSNGMLVNIPSDTADTEALLISYLVSTSNHKPIAYLPGLSVQPILFFLNNYFFLYVGDE